MAPEYETDTVKLVTLGIAVSVFKPWIEKYANQKKSATNPSDYELADYSQRRLQAGFFEAVQTLYPETILIEASPARDVFLACNGHVKRYDLSNLDPQTHIVPYSLLEQAAQNYQNIVRRVY